MAYVSPEGLHATRYQLAEGREGILQTARAMRAMVEEFKRHPHIRALALQLVETLDQKDYLGEIELIFTYVRDRIRYVRDIYGVETLSTPEVTLQSMQGDCDDKATLLAALLESVGYPTLFKLTGYSGRDYEHVFVMTQLPNGTMLALDATEPEPMGYEPPNPTTSLMVD